MDSATAKDGAMRALSPLRRGHAGGPVMDDRRIPSDPIAPWFDRATKAEAELASLRAECDALRASCVEALEHANFVDTPEGRDRANIGGIRGCLLTVRDILESALAAPRKEGER